MSQLIQGVGAAAGAGEDRKWSRSAGSAEEEGKYGFEEESKAEGALVSMTAEEEDATWPVVSVSIRDAREVHATSRKPAHTELFIVSSRTNGEVQEVWRSLEEFDSLAQSLKASGVDGIELPSQRWYHALVGSVHRDSLRLRQSLLDNFLKAVLASPQARESAAFRAFLRPYLRHDWPSPLGAIDLWKHDLPHESSQTEWWYFHSHFQDAAGHEYSIFAAFFRIVKHEYEDGEKTHAHALNWALSDVHNEEYYQEIVLDKDSPGMIKKMIENGSLLKDRRLRRAYMEVLDKGNVPRPDHMFAEGNDAKVGEDKLDLDYEKAHLTKDSSGRYQLHCQTRNGDAEVELLFEPRKPAVRHGEHGVVKGHGGDDMFYYLIPRCEVTGRFRVANGDWQSIAQGQGWFDHEFGGRKPREGDPPMQQYAWNWAAVQLDNGHELSVARLVDPGDYSKPEEEMREMDRQAIVIDPAGDRVQPKDLEFVGEDYWTSVRTFMSYPTAWQLRIPSLGIDLRIKAAFDDQEFVTLIAKPAYWEGRMSVEGTFRGQAVTGKGYVERNGFQVMSELKQFFGAVGKEVQRAAQRVYPDVLDRDSGVNLIALPKQDYYLDGVDLAKVNENLLSPVRYIIDQGGKSWRSYGALASIDVVGGNSRDFVDWLAMPEFLHVGSLIVDDLEDGSMLRRGVECVHLKYNTSVAINSGTAAYFMGQKMLRSPKLNEAQMNRAYEYYFAALRGGHAGQALDIAGLHDEMERALETGDATLLESRVLAIHRLKTAAPAGMLARIGAIAGGGTEEQIESVGRYFESLGVAFQIMDDVLNLRGLFRDPEERRRAKSLKMVGEDIMEGKVTIPVAKAVSRLPREEMIELWNVIRSKPQDVEVVHRCIDKLEACGAIEACESQARRVIEESWIDMDAHSPDSFSKIMLRAFGWFVVDRYF